MPTYTIKNRQGQTLDTKASVLGVVTLANVATTSGSAEVTCTSTSGCFPFMAVSIPNVPEGCFVVSVKNSTTLVLGRSVYTSGAWTTSTANAQATATASSLTGYAYGFHPHCVIEKDFAKGMWRNVHYTSTSGGSFWVSTSTTEMVNNNPFGIGVAMVPTTGSFTNGMYTTTAADFRVSDTLSASPAKRHNGEKWGYYPFVHTGGVLSSCPADESLFINCSSLT